MTVELAPRRLPVRSAPGKRLHAPGTFTKMRIPGMLLACAGAVCAIGGCGGRDSDMRATLTSGAARELAQLQPDAQAGTHSLAAQRPPLEGGFAPASDAASSNPVDSANSAACCAIAVRSPARPPVGASASGSQDEPLVTPVIHTAE
jgi:hypothetical protein